MRNGIFVLFVLIAGAGQAGRSAAGPVASPVVPDMVAAADLVIVGRVVETEFQADPSVGEIGETYYVSPDCVLKDANSTETGLVKAVVDWGENSTGVVSRDCGVFFLKIGPDGFYHGVDPSHPILRASPWHRSDQPTSSDPSTAVAIELVHFLATPVAALTDPYVGVKGPSATTGDRISTPSTQAQFLFLEAIWPLYSIPSSKWHDALREVASSSEQPLSRLWAVAGLLYIGDSEYLQSVVPILLDHPDELNITVTELIDSIESAPQPSSSLPFLIDLLRSTDVQVRHAAATRIGAIGTGAAIRPLAQIALVDRDPSVRMIAAVGLCQVTNQMGPPCTLAYSETNHAAFWSLWKKANGID
jgi:hypothetical protein